MNNTTTIILAEGGMAAFQQFLPLIIIFVIFWVILIRPQQKQRKALAAKQAALKKGDKVVTIGGMHATINAVSETTVSLKLSEGTIVKYDKTAIATVMPKGGKSETVAEQPKG